MEDPLLGGVFGTHAHLLHFGNARLLDRDVSEVANNGIDILANIPHLGKFGCLDLDERGICQARQATRNLGLANAGGAYHQNVLRCDFSAQSGLYLLAPPAIAQGNRDGSLGLMLANNVLVEFDNNFLGCHGRAQSPKVSTM